MSYLDANVPADTEAVKLGASQIRNLKTSLNPLIAKIFTDAGAFKVGWVTDLQLGPECVDEDNIEDGAVTQRKVANGVARTHVGTYAGSASAVTVGSLPFAPDVLVIMQAHNSAFGIAVRAEATGGIGPIHPAWGHYAASVVSPFSLTSTTLDTAIHWTADGFVVDPVTGFNSNGATFFFLAIKV